MTNPSPALEHTLPQGFTMRPAQMDDNDAVVAIYNACDVKMVGREECEPDRFTRQWKTPNFFIENSTRVVLNTEGIVIGYTAIWDDADSPVYPYLTLAIHPDYEDQGIDDFLLQWTETRRPAIIERCPDDARVAYRAGAMRHNQALIDCLKRAGYERVRHFWEMHIQRPDEIPQPQIPEGVHVKVFNYDDDTEFEALIRADQEAFSDHWGFVERPFEELKKFWISRIEDDSRFDPTLWFLAIDDHSGEVAGICLCIDTLRNDPSTAYVDTLGVRRAWRKRGLGLALLQHAFIALWQRDKQAIVLSVDASNLTGATRLYERAGMSIYRQGALYEKEMRPGKDLSVT